MTQTQNRADRWKVDLPEGERNGVALRKFEVEPNSFENMRLAIHGQMPTRPGVYTKLTRNGALWMSDTDSEVRDHMEAYYRMKARGGRVLVAGLGLGMIVKWLLAEENIEHIDVVEIDPDVAALVGQHYESERCTIHVADIFEIKWEPGTSWMSAWFDIWPDKNEDNLDEMARLARSYGRRVQWKGYWSKEELLRIRRSTANAWWRR